MTAQQLEIRRKENPPPSVEEILNQEWLAVGVSQKELDRERETSDIFDRLMGSGYAPDIVRAAYAAEYVNVTELYLRLLAIAECALPPNDPMLALILYSLAKQNQAGGNLAAAEPFYARAFNIRKDTFGFLHPQTVEVFMDYAILLKELNRLSEVSTDYCLILLKPEARYTVQKTFVLDELEERGYVSSSEALTQEGYSALTSKDGRLQIGIQAKDRFVEAVVISLNISCIPETLQQKTTWMMQPVVCRLSRMEDEATASGTSEDDKTHGRLIMNFRRFISGEVIDGKCPGCHNMLQCPLCKLEQ